jgi:hypothetical protein
MRCHALLACAVTVLLLAECGDSGSTSGSSTNSTGPVATWRLEGGLLAPGLPQLIPPRLAVYGDGRAIADAAYVIRLRPSEVNRLVTALTQDLKAIPPSPSPPSTVMDAPVTVMTAGRLHVQALGIDAMRGYPTRSNTAQTICDGFASSGSSRTCADCNSPKYAPFSRKTEARDWSKPPWRLRCGSCRSAQRPPPSTRSLSSLPFTNGSSPRFAALPVRTGHDGTARASDDEIAPSPQRTTTS